MPYGDGIPKINCYSLTDFHDFDDCPFRFFVRHTLDRKYEIDESNAAIALGNLLDQSIKRFHKEELYGTKSSKRLIRLVRDSAEEMKRLAAEAKIKGKHHFYEATIPFLTEEVVTEAIRIFTDYYVTRKGDIRRSMGDVGFCEWIIEGGKKPTEKFKLWGGPDTLEMGKDGIPEIADYKSRQNLEKGKTNIDMDLMPKIYVLLCSEKLRQQGYKKARFVVRFWQDPLDESFYEEFDLEVMSASQFLFKQKIDRILSTIEFKPCGRKYCAACKSVKKDEFLKALAEKGFKSLSGEEFLEEKAKEDDYGLPF